MSDAKTVANRESSYKRSYQFRRTLATLATLGGIFTTLLVPGVANAAFTRPFLREIARAENTPNPSTKPCSEAERVAAGSTCLDLRANDSAGGIAVDGEVPGAEGDVWVGSGPVLDQFSPAYEVGEPNHFLESEAGGAANLAIERGSGKKYRERRRQSAVAVDNAPENDMEDPSRCTVLGCVHYLTVEGYGGGVEKLSSGEAQVPFECTHAQCEYVEGNKITGIPGVPKGVFGSEGLDGVAVDAAGDIFAANGNRNAVYEYKASGEFVREFRLNSGEVPEVRSELGRGYIEGIGIDPVSGHLLVSVYANPEPSVRFGAIDEFEIKTGKFASQIVDTSAGGELEHPVGIAVDAKGDLYVVDQEQNVVVVYGRGAYDPSVTLGEARQRTPTSAVLTGSVNPAQRGNPTPPMHLEACYFQYVGEKAFNEVNPVTKAKEGFSHAKTEPCEEPDAAEFDAEPKEPEVAQPVHARVTGLSSGETYRYRLVASNEEAKQGGVAETVTLAFTAPDTPVVVSATATNVSSTFAALHAQIDPLGAATSYHFEYDTREYHEGEGAHGVSVPVPDGSLGEGGATGSSLESVVQDIGGLTPGTTYYFRVVATNEVGPNAETEASRGTFTTLPEVASAERGYELVTPAQKEGGGDMFAEPETSYGEFVNVHDDGTPSASGEAFLLETNSPFGAFPFAIEGAYVLRREPAKGGWSYTSLAGEKLGVQSFESVVFDQFDFSRVAIDDGLGAKVGSEGESLTNLLGPPGASSPPCASGTSLEGALAGSCYIELHKDSVPFHLDADEASDTKVVGASEDLDHVVLESRSEPVTEGKEAELCPGASVVTHGEVLCEWAGGALRLVNVKPGSEGAVPVSACGAGIGDSSNLPYGGKAGSAYRAVSADGSRVLFTAPDPNTPRKEGAEGCWNGAAEEAENGPLNAPQLYVRVGGSMTLKVSAPEKGVKEGSGKPHEYPAYYAGASEDGSRVFFVTKTWVTQNHPAGHDLELYECQLTEVEGELGCALTRVSAGEKGQPGFETGAGLEHVTAVSADGSAVYFEAKGKLTADAPASGGLYRYSTQTNTTSYISPGGQWEPNERAQSECPRIFCSVADWYTTPDGQYLLYVGPSGLERYDAAAGSLTTIAGAGAEFAISAMGESEVTSSPVAAISENGEYVFFDTPEQLVPQASNQSGEHPTLDTYEWHDGRISLIGDPTDPSPTFFLGYSPYSYYSNTKKEEVKVEGGNVFIGTHAKLTAQDTGGIGNVYDARICEAESPCIEPPSGKTAICEGGSCQHPPPAPPDPTATLLAPPAPVTPAAETKKVTKKASTCRKGYVRKKVKKKEACVKQKAKKKAKKSNHGRTGR